SFDNIHIDNNTFLDHTCCVGPQVAISNYQVQPTVTSSEIQNNLFFHNTINQSILIATSSGFSASDWSIDYNVLSGSTSLDVDGTSPYAQAHGRSCTPVFVNYLVDDISSDVHLAAADNCAKDAGTPLTGLFTVDKDGVPRPQGSAWDIGAFELKTGAAPSAPR